MQTPDKILELTGYATAHVDGTELPFAFPIRLAVVNGKFWVEYGEDCATELSYEDAATKLGCSILHALTCDSCFIE